jgi:MFS family permease
MPEPVEGAESRQLRIRPTRLRVPTEVRSVFIPAVIAGFAGFAVLGLFTAVAPAFLGEVLGETNHAVTGLVVLAVFGSSTIGQLARGRLEAPTALPLGCAILIVGLALLGVSLHAEELALLIAGGVIAGFGQGMAIAAALASVNEAAPPEHRAAVASSFFVICYVAISIPVIGVGLLADRTDLVTAGTVFTAVDAVLAALAIAGILRLRRLRSTP